MQKLIEAAIAMPSKIIKGFKFQFYSVDRGEPPHIHVVKAEKR